MKITFDLPDRLLSAVKRLAEARGIPAESWIREAITVAIAQEVLPAEHGSPASCSARRGAGGFQSVREVADYLNVSPRHLYNVLASGRLGCVPVGRLSGSSGIRSRRFSERTPTRRGKEKHEVRREGRRRLPLAGAAALLECTRERSAIMAKTLYHINKQLEELREDLDDGALSIHFLQEEKPEEAAETVQLMAEVAGLLSHSVSNFMSHWDFEEDCRRGREKEVAGATPASESEARS